MIIYLYVGLFIALCLCCSSCSSSLAPLGVAINNDNKESFKITGQGKNPNRLSGDVRPRRMREELKLRKKLMKEKSLLLERTQTV